MAPSGYRPDIDGLRAIAVSAVILNHAFPAALPGGFCGVDVFFVISGYLITRILRAEHEAGCSLLGFYERRVRRLFPALLAMLFLSMAVGYVFLLPTEYEALGAHIAAGTVFGQNVMLWRESGYFAVDSFRVPLQHLWSLAVEEQFYLLFPPLLVAAWRRRWPVTAMLTAITIASFVANLVASRHHHSAAFYLTPYRAWELLAGALLACRESCAKPMGPQWQRDRASLLGGALLSLSLAAANSSGYPGWQAAIPVSAAALLIAAGPHGLINRLLLAHPLAIGVGLISYPLYLFHWPLLCLVRICRNGAASPLLLATAVIAAFALAALTYATIERPLRGHRSRATVSCLVCGFLLAGTAGMSLAAGWIPPRNASPELDGVVVAMRDTFERYLRSRPAACRRRRGIGATGGDGPQTLFFGDSFASQYLPRIIHVTGGNSGDARGVMVLAEGAMPPIPGVTSRQKQGIPELMQRFRTVLASEPRIDRVVIAACWPFYFEPERDYAIQGTPLHDAAGAERAAAAFDGLLAELKASGRNVTLVLTSPMGSELEPAAMLVRDLRGRIARRHPALEVGDLRARFGPHARSFLAAIEAAARRHGMRIVDPLDHLVVDGVCIADAGGIPIRYDMSHLRPGYVGGSVTYLDETMAH